MRAVFIRIRQENQGASENMKHGIIIRVCELYNKMRQNKIKNVLKSNTPLRKKQIILIDGRDLLPFMQAIYARIVESVYLVVGIGN
jgi:hypothetical protein